MGGKRNERIEEERTEEEEKRNIGKGRETSRRYKYPTINTDTYTLNEMGMREDRWERMRKMERGEKEEEEEEREEE